MLDPNRWQRIAPETPTMAPPAPNSSINPFLRTILPASQQLQPDQVKQQYESIVPQIRITPLAPSANASQNSVIIREGIAAVSVSSGSVSGLNFRNLWQSSTFYNVNDMVLWKNSTYLAVAASTNAQPDTNSANWTLLANVFLALQLAAFIC